MGKLKNFSIKDIAEMIEARINNKFDARIVVDGVTGSGKSTFIWKLCCRLKKGIVPFNPYRDIIYSREDSIKHLANKVKGIIFNDEAIQIGYKRSFYDEQQKKLIIGLNMFRDSFNVYILTIPKFSSLDFDLRELCSMRITILKRGIGLLQMPKISMYSSDSWDMKYNMRIEDEWSNSKNKKPKYGLLSTAVGFVHFGDLSPRAKEIYIAIKKEKRNKVFGEQTDFSLVADPEKMFYDKLIELMRKGKLTPDALQTACVINGKEYDTIRRKLNARLRVEGDKYKVKDYVMDAKKKERKDLLGFALPYKNEAQANTQEIKRKESNVEYKTKSFQRG